MKWQRLYNELWMDPTDSFDGFDGGDVHKMALGEPHNIMVAHSTNSDKRPNFGPGKGTTIKIRMDKVERHVERNKVLCMGIAIEVPLGMKAGACSLLFELIQNEDEGDMFVCRHPPENLYEKEEVTKEILEAWGIHDQLELL